MKLLTDARTGTIVVEHKDRLTRFGFNYIDQLLTMQSRKLEVIFPTDTHYELVDDFVLTGAIHIFKKHIQLPGLGKLRICLRKKVP